jgi:LPXTG-site transpeptidase (sortase) family protein
MLSNLQRGRLRLWLVIFVGATVTLGIGLLTIEAANVRGTFIPISTTDMTPNAPLSNPTPGATSSRYISGIGLDNSFTVFFEDRLGGWLPPVVSVSTTTGPTGFPSGVTNTTVNDTHFVIKDMPYTYLGTPYSYRAWGAVGNTTDHRFYVSNDLINWTLVSTFTIPNDPGFTSARGFVYYGFHDVILINGTYYAWAEANSGETMLVRSPTGADDWEAFDKVGGNQLTDGPLLTPADTVSPTPTGSFVDLGFDRGFGKIYIPGDDSGLYLAVNTVAKAGQAPAVLEANFIDPANWTWNDGSIGRLTPAHALLYQTVIHDYREAWVVPRSDLDDPWVIMYTGDYSGTRALGYAILLADPGPTPTPTDTPTATITPTPIVTSTPIPGELPQTGFPPGQNTLLPVQSSSETYLGYHDLWLEIPALQVKVPIVGIPYTTAGWNVSWLANQAGYLEGTAFPTLPGNTVLTAHAYDANGMPGPFVDLDSLRFGDQIHIHAWGFHYVYEIRTNTLVKPDDLSVLKHETLDWVTLLTCQGYNPQSDLYEWRRTARAVLVRIQ